mgnify:CR=1 FL=1
MTDAVPSHGPDVREQRLVFGEERSGPTVRSGRLDGIGLDQFERLLASCERATATLSDAVLGVAPHSLRAVDESEMRALERPVGEPPDGPSRSHRVPDGVVPVHHPSPGSSAAGGTPPGCVVLLGTTRSAYFSTISW